MAGRVGERLGALELHRSTHRDLLYVVFGGLRLLLARDLDGIVFVCALDSDVVVTGLGYVSKLVVFANGLPTATAQKLSFVLVKS